MTHLHLVRENEPADNHSRRPEHTEEYLLDLEGITRLVLAPADLAVAELRNAIINRDRDAAVAACRRLLAAGLCGKDQADFIERHPA